jgi:hypothetical protein
MAVCLSGAVAGSARAGCFPVKSDVVSLGEVAARFYAQRSLDRSVDGERERVESTGAAVGRVVKKELSCKPYPNLIGANEWRCLGEARVCTKS